MAIEKIKVGSTEHELIASGLTDESAEKIKLNATNIAYGTCPTAAGTAAKVVTISGNSNWTLATGSLIVVKFTNTNTASKVTLNVNSTGAKSIWYNTAAYTSTSSSVCGTANRYTTYMYDGTYWVWISNGTDTNTTYSAATTSAAGLMSAPDKSKLNYTNIAYGTCSTAAATAAKVITVSGNTNWTLTAGSIITIKFSETNTASNPTFNVNGTGAKSVGYGNGGTLTTSSLSMAGYKDRPMMYMYDGSKFVFISWSYDANTTYTNVSLGQGYGTCSTAAATAAKVVTLSNYALVTGGIVSVKFTYAVPASATMNINSKGAKNIYHRGAKITAGVINAGDIATFIYDGTQYHLIANDNNFSTMTSDLTISKSSPYLYLKNTSTTRTARMASTSDKYLSLYNEVTGDASNNRTALWLGPETNSVNSLLSINHVVSGTAKTYNVLHTGNSNRTTLVATETAPTTAGVINWVYG